MTLKNKKFQHMKIFKTIFATFLLSFLFAGCEEELNLEPRQQVSTEVAISSGENIQNILIGAYDEAGHAEGYGGQLQMMADLYGFTDEASWVGTFQQPREVFNKRIFVDNIYVRDFWLNAYEVINQTNLVIDNIEVVDEDVQDRVSGEAHFLRGLSYFDLVRMFGAPYEPGAENSQPGVPINTEGIIDYSQDLEIPRSSVEEGYNQAISDLTTAYELLPEENSFFADKYAAQALLARLYLQQGDYDAARDAANDVIENSGHELEDSYAAAFNNDADSDEDVFAFQVTTQSGSNLLNIHYADQSFGGRGGDITINDEYLENFDSDNDERASFFYNSAQSGERLTTKYQNQFGNIPLIRLAEMYLIRAEANLREGTEIGATPLEDVNRIRSRAGADELDSVTVEDVLRERELELAFEGHLIHDLKRTNQNVGELTYDADALVFPIPRREMDANSLLEQNPGYGN